MRSVSLVIGAALAVAIVLSAGAEQAALPPAPTQAPAPLTVTPDTDMRARRMARRAARVDQDIQTLRAGLQLAPAQDALWPAVADAIHGVDAARGFRYRQTLAAAPSAVDGLKLQGDHMAAMGVAIGKLAEATRPLVTTFTADQRSRLPGLLQSVRLPKVTGRALDVPPDTGGSSWGTGGLQGQGQGRQDQGRQDQGRQDQGQQAGPDRSWGIGPQGPGDTGATRRDLVPSGQAPAGGASLGGPSAAPRAGAIDEPADGADDE